MSSNSIQYFSDKDDFSDKQLRYYFINGVVYFANYHLKSDVALNADLNSLTGPFFLVYLRMVHFWIWVCLVCRTLMISFGVTSKILVDSLQLYQVKHLFIHFFILFTVFKQKHYLCFMILLIFLPQINSTTARSFKMPHNRNLVWNILIF